MTKFTVSQLLRKSVNYPTLSINGINIKRVANFNFLGIQLNIYSSIPLKKPAFCLKTSHFINKYDSPRSQLCQWPRLVHNCNQSFNMSQPSVYFDSHQNIPASHLGIPGGIENLNLQY